MSNGSPRGTMRLRNDYMRDNNDQAQADYKNLSNHSMRQTYNNLLQRRNDSFHENRHNNNNANGSRSFHDGRDDLQSPILDNSSAYNKFKRSIHHDNNNNNRDDLGLLLGNEDVDEDDEEYIEYDHRNMDDNLNDEEIDYLDHTSDENITDEYSESELDMEKDNKYLANDDDDDDYDEDVDIDYGDDEDLQNDSFDRHTEYNFEKNYNSFSWKNILLCILLITAITYFVRIGDNFTNTEYNFEEKNTKKNPLFQNGKENSLTNIQKQINHLYDELSNRDNMWNMELDDKIKLIINQFEKNIRKLMPNNILNFQKQLDNLYGKIEFIEKKTKNNNYGNKVDKLFHLNNVTNLQEQLITELENNLPTQIPVMINNSSHLLMIPELHNYFSSLVSNIIKYSQVDNESDANSIANFNNTLNYDLNDYIKEILTNELQYVDKLSFIHEINERLQENKFEILEELKSSIQNEISKAKSSLHNDNNYQNTNNNLSKRYSTILLKKLINHIYNTNQYQWEDDLDFATFAQGTRLLKSLTSNNYPRGNGVTSLELLSDVKLSSSSTYWQCPVSSNGCSLAFRFSKPLYLLKISYLHGRFINNLHMMNSAPKKISIFVKLNNKLQNAKLLEIAKSNGQGNFFFKEKSFIKIGEYEYDLLDKNIKQQFPLPMWFIQTKPLVKSIIFNMDENYGNDEYISIRKFIINAVTQDDLEILKSNSFALGNKESSYDPDSDDTFGDSIPHYHVDGNRRPTHPHITLNKRQVGIDSTEQKKRIPAFGQDELVQ